MIDLFETATDFNPERYYPDENDKSNDDNIIYAFAAFMIDYNNEIEEDDAPPPANAKDVEKHPKSKKYIKAAEKIVKHLMSEDLINLVSALESNDSGAILRLMNKTNQTIARRKDESSLFGEFPTKTLYTVHVLSKTDKKLSKYALMAESREDALNKTMKHHLLVNEGRVCRTDLMKCRVKINHEPTKSIDTIGSDVIVLEKDMSQKKRTDENMLGMTSIGYTQRGEDKRFAVDDELARLLDLADVGGHSESRIDEQEVLGRAQELVALWEKMGDDQKSVLREALAPIFSAKTKLTERRRR